MNTILSWVLVVNPLFSISLPVVPVVFSPVVVDKASCEAMREKLLSAETRAKSACVEILPAQNR